MLSRLFRFIRRFFNKSRKINHEPINKASLIVIILVDLFILFNVFAGLDSIAQWPISPSQAYPCYQPWQEYRSSPATQNREYDFFDRSLKISQGDFSRLFRGFSTYYKSGGEDRLGDVSPICLRYEDARDVMGSPDNLAIARQIRNNLAEIDSFRNKISTTRSQYDSTLLEEIAGQSRDRSINNVGAAQARDEIESAQRAIAQREEKLDALKEDFTNTSVSQAFLELLNDEQAFATVDKGHSRAAFFYPSIQLFFQALFLLPLLVITSAIHRLSQRKGYGYVALISWHLLAIFSIPLIWKVFEFLQVGFLFEWIADFIYKIFGQLQFLFNYVQILLIPLVGFGIIKFFQKVVFNTRLQAANRVQKMQCVRCAKRIRKHDIHCPHCQYEQYQECTNCHNLTYRHLAYCKHCGTSQMIDL